LGHQLQLWHDRAIDFVFGMIGNVNFDFDFGMIGDLDFGVIKPSTSTWHVWAINFVRIL
jgi:hypothetical protein